jgi:hypothetical protein
MMPLQAFDTGVARWFEHKTSTVSETMCAGRTVFVSHNPAADQFGIEHTTVQFEHGDIAHSCGLAPAEVG